MKKEEREKRLALKSMIFKKAVEVLQLKRNIDVAEFFSISPQVALSWSNGGWDEFSVYEKVKTKINPGWLLSGEGNPEISAVDNSESEYSLVIAENERLKKENELYKQIIDNYQTILKINK